MADYSNSKKDAFFKKIEADVFYLKLAGVLDEYLDSVESGEETLSIDEFVKQHGDN